MAAKRTAITDLPSGRELLGRPLLNKGSAFSADERQALGLEGMLPARYNTQAQQSERVWRTLSSIHEPLAKYRELSALQDRNEYLYYRVLMDHLEALMPIVYTPTVGLATQNFSAVFQRARGLWLTPEHRGNMKALIKNAAYGAEVELMVVTDNESILGIGDQGAGGMAISIGKLALYTAAAGIRPEGTLPVSLDVGTANPALLNDPEYLGWQAPRLTGNEYRAFVDEFVTAVTELYPRACIQWEDFRKSNALSIMNEYRPTTLSFNDDIQGTGAVAVAGVMSALAQTGASLPDQRILIHGAGAAGLGISNQLRAALKLAGVAEHDMSQRLAVLDSGGLLVLDRDFSDSYKKDLAWPAEQAEAAGLGASTTRDLAAVVAAFQPTVLIGTSGQAGAFDEPLIRAIAGYCERPIIMPLSNPTANTEAAPADLLAWTDGRALIATGSPFEPVTIDGRRYEIGQGNNVFIFPGLGLGSLAVHASRISNAMITAAAEALAANVSTQEREAGLLYPRVDRLREVTRQVAIAVARQALDEQLAAPDGDLGADPTPQALAAYIDERMWEPDYPTYV